MPLCSVTVQPRDDAAVEASSIDPAATMNAVGNPGLAALADRGARRARAGDRDRLSGIPEKWTPVFGQKSCKDQRGGAYCPLGRGLYPRVIMGSIAIQTFAGCATVAIMAFAAPAHAAEARYACSDGAKLTARFSPPSAANGRVALTFDSGRRITLAQAMSADGGRYVGDNIEFWIKGRNATLTRGGASVTCSTR
jgi:membrane-bound inhibitor of C-type lysozyme